MAIFINYTNKSLQFYSNNLEKEQDSKSISKDSKVILENNENLTEDNFSDEKLAEENLENLVDSDAESENNDAETVENFQEEISQIKESTLDFSEKNMIKYDFENIDEVSVEEFFNKFGKNELKIPEKLLERLKKEKQLLVLPDELVSFDFIMVPNLGVVGSMKSLNTKLSLNYKQIDKLGKNIKIVNKIKPNIIYGIQLARQEIAKKVNDFISSKGVRVKGLNFYSGCLGSFYSSHIRGAKNASIVVKIAENKTTILALIHGTVVATTTLQCGERDVYRNITYKFDEYSRRSMSHKFVCYSASKIGGETDNKKLNEKVTKDQIEKVYSKAKLNPLAGNFQFKSINIVDYIRRKIDEMIMFIKNSEVSIGIDKIFVDVKNIETFEKLKISNAVKVYFTEEEIFKSSKPNEILKSNVISSIISGKFSWSSLWKKLNKKA